MANAEGAPTPCVQLQPLALLMVIPATATICPVARLMVSALPMVVPLSCGRAMMKLLPASLLPPLRGVVRVHVPAR